MSKKIKGTPTEEREDRINRVLSHLTHKDLQRECVLRGIEFKNIVDWDHHKLSNWFYHNFEKGEDIKRLSEYDIWLEGQLQERGYKKGDAALHPSLRFGFTPDLTKLPPPEKPKGWSGVIKIEDAPKPKREKDEKSGVYKGTKKALTYELAMQGYPIDVVITKVQEKFEDAKEKSIKIWFKRVEKTQKK